MRFAGEQRFESRVFSGEGTANAKDNEVGHSWTYEGSEGWSV